jgi:hypothetical protein
MPRRAAKAAKIDLALVTGDGCSCGACHQRIPTNGGICFGRPGFVVPAINVCRRCIEIGLAIVGPEERETKEGKC